jgi:hypothetical protein
MSKVLWTLSRCGYYDERMADFVHGMVDNLQVGGHATGDMVHSCSLAGAWPVVSVHMSYAAWLRLVMAR